MMSIFVVFIIAVIIAAIEVPALIKKKWVKELGVFSTLLVIAVVFSIAHYAEMDIPSPFDLLTAILEPLQFF